MATRKKPADKYHHGALRPALIATAWTYVAKHGVDTLSLRSVADALGVSHAAPAHHFAGKEELVDALRAEAWKRFAEVLERAEHGPDRLRATGRAYVEFALENPNQMQLMFRASPKAPSGEVVAQSERAWRALVDGVTGEVGPKRAANMPEVMSMAVAAWSAVHGLSALLNGELLAPGLPTDAATRSALRERVLEVVVAGIKHAAK